MVQQMIPVKEEEEKAVLSEDDREMEEKDEDEEAEESVEDDSASEEDDDGDVEPEDVSDGNGAKKAEDSSQTLDKTKKHTEEKKPPGGLNVNNEVVKMRKEVKRVRALIIRKLTRQIGKLKKKKGKEADVERNQRRAGRLLEEIHAMKVLTPDKVASPQAHPTYYSPPKNRIQSNIHEMYWCSSLLKFFSNDFICQVTKTALQKNLSFEQECKNPKSTAADRAVARIATHPQFNKKIKDIKAAVAVFKEERKRDGKEKQQNKGGKVTVQSEKKRETKSVDQKDVVVEEQKALDTEEGASEFQSSVDVDLTEPNTESKTVIQSAEKTAGNYHSRGEMPQAKTVRAATAKNPQVKDFVRNASKMKEEPDVTAESQEESDLDSSGDEEEKEYFDDSTEERFHRQSSHSEESEEDDDFFVGKVSKFKKKKKQKDAELVKRNGEQTGADQSKRDKVTSLDSIFCSSLARSQPGRGRGAGRGRIGDRGRGRGESRGVDGPKAAFGKHSKFQVKPPGTDRGRGRGRGGVTRKNDHRDKSVSSAEPALHPSWEASKKRKEQQGQILAFQGKKIKFDDDD